ncbi:Adenine phosphoribosyltransferase [bacterium HR39]|nr:Adenine phosphoribosyltransferase [bacterium HR39]
MDLGARIRRIPDCPKPGVLFYDISTLLVDTGAWSETIRRLAELARDFRPAVLAAIESRGFLLAAPLALELGIGFVMVRKVGKLPGVVVSHSYDLEYGSDTLQMAEGLVKPGSRALVVDDLIATGGTAAAAVELLRKVGAEPVGALFLIELVHLKGMEKLGVPGRALLQFDGTS